MQVAGLLLPSRFPEIPSPEGEPYGHQALELGQKSGFKAFLRNSLNNLETDGTIRRHFAPDASVPVFI
jgi:hypothetical protein